MHLHKIHLSLLVVTNLKKLNWKIDAKLNITTHLLDVLNYEIGEKTTPSAGRLNL